MWTEALDSRSSPLVTLSVPLLTYLNLTTSEGPLVDRAKSINTSPRSGRSLATVSAFGP